MVLAKFSKRSDKDLFILKQKKKKKDLYPAHLSLLDSTQIYIIDSLTQARRILLARTGRWGQRGSWLEVYVG